MKIGFDAKRLYCNFTGLGNYSRAIVKNFFDFYPNKKYYLYTPQVKENLETSFFLQNPQFQTHVAKTFLKSYWRSFLLIKQLKKDKIQLYHGLSNEIPSGLKKNNIKSLVTIHDLIFKVFPQTYGFIDRHTYDIKFKKSCQNADKIIAISESTKQDIIKFYNIAPSKIEVIYQSCNPLFYKLLPPKESKQIIKENKLPQEYLLFVGSIEKRKNLKLLIEAYQYLPNKLKIPVVVVGKGSKSHKKELLQLIEEKEMTKKVIWIYSLKSNHHLQAIYQQAMALVYPSVYEGFGLPVVEALLSKTPVITSNTSSLPEAGGPSSLYVNPNDAQELATAIQKVLTKPQLRKTMIENGYRYAHEKFSPKQVTQKLMQCYQEILS